MVIDIYMLFLMLSVSFIFIGYQYDSEILRMIGFTVIFFMGVLIFTTHISYSSGSNIEVINSSFTVVTKNYTEYQNFSLGLFLAVIGAVSFFLTFFELRNNFRGRD